MVHREPNTRNRMIQHPDMLELAFEYFGLKEIKGEEHNPQILEFFKTIGHSWVQSDETAWCAAYVGAMGERTGYITSKALNARSYLKIGIPVTVPQVGNIVVFWRGSPNSWKGHVGFYIGERDGFIYCLGGNQNNQVKISRYPVEQLLGYRRLQKRS